MLKALVGGCFSFENGHATAGDLLACELVCDWLREAGLDFDVARVSALGPGIDWATADPAAYSHVVYVCGPFERGAELETRFLLRFGQSRLIGVDLSMLTPLSDWNPFDFLIERDSTRAANPDITFASKRPHVPVVGVCRVEDYPGAAVEAANAAIDRLLAASPVARIEIDTRLDQNGTALRSAAEVESVLARMDAVVTTRLHGLALSLKNGVPVVAIDPEPGGAKLRRQASVLDWPAILNVDGATELALQQALAWCLGDEGRARARRCSQQAAERVDELRRSFVSAIRDSAAPGAAPAARRAATVSVVVRDLGNEAWLAEALRSVADQSQPAHEIIVARGSSAADARNDGAATSTGEYLLFMDADEKLLPHALRSLLNGFHLYPQSAFVYGLCRQVDSGGRVRERYAPLFATETYAAALTEPLFEGPAILYRREQFKAAGGFEAAADASAHYDLCLRIAAHHPAQGIGDTVAECRIHPASARLRAGPVLAASLRALSAQWPRARNRPDQAHLFAFGIRRARVAARTPLFDHVHTNLARGRLLTVMTSLGHVLAYLPALISSFGLQWRTRVRARP